MPEHAKLFSPSGAPRWTRCPGSAKACADYPRTSNAFADDGSALHSFAADMLNGKDPLGSVFVAGTGSYHCDEDSMDLLEEYVETVRAQVEEGDVLLVETRHDFMHLLPEETQAMITWPEAFGTVDAVVIKVAKKELQIHDLKTGRKEVSAEHNEQLTLYALAALEEHSLLYDIEKVTLHIHMPRKSNSSWELPWSDVHKDTFRYYMQDCLADDPAFIPGEIQCKWCDHKPNCKAIEEDILAEFMGNDDEDNLLLAEDPGESVAELPEDRLASLLNKAPMIKNWVEAVEKAAYSIAMDGATLSGFKLVQNRPGNSTWTDAKEVEAWLRAGRKAKRANMYKEALITPTQALKRAIVGPRNLAKMNAMIHRPPGKIVLVPESDKRDAYVLPDIASEFDNEE